MGLTNQEEGAANLAASTVAQGSAVGQRWPSSAPPNIGNTTPAGSSKQPTDQPAGSTLSQLNGISEAQPPGKQAHAERFPNTGHPFG